jgi:hypothetical protein
MERRPRGGRAVNIALTVGQRSSWRGLLASLAAFWPHKDAQRCRLLRISEYRFDRSAAEWAGSECARHSLRIRCFAPTTSPIEGSGPVLSERCRDMQESFVTCNVLVCAGPLVTSQADNRGGRALQRSSAHPIAGGSSPRSMPGATASGGHERVDDSSGAGWGGRSLMVSWYQSLPVKKCRHGPRPMTCVCLGRSAWPWPGRAGRSGNFL